MALFRLRRPCAPCAASSSARSFMPCPVCARTCWILTSAPSARSCARAFLLRATSALCLRDAQAPVVVQIASCESERMSTASSGRRISRAPLSAWCTADSSAVLLVARPAPRYSGCVWLRTTLPHSSLTAPSGEKPVVVASFRRSCVVRTAVRPQPAWPPLPEPSVASTRRRCWGSAGRGLRQLARIRVHTCPLCIVARPVLIHAFWNSGYADLLQAVRFCNS